MPSLISKSLIVAAALLSIVEGAPSNLLTRTGKTLVTGIQMQGKVPSRLELREFIKDPTRLNLYLLALERLQSQDTSSPLSYYGIAGIHGTNLQWDGDDGGKEFGDLSWGYCRHADPLFPSWHRPYMSLYEKTLYDLAQKIVSEFTEGSDKQKHQEVLSTFRIPYWDWAADSSMPEVIGATQGFEKVEVIKPKVGKVKIHNPFFSFQFPKMNDVAVALDSEQNINTKETVRNPAVDKKTNAYINRPEYTNRQMIEVGSNLKNYVFNMFSRVKDYKTFSNMGSGSGSIESVHGTIHITVGGLQRDGELEGHMTNPLYAGFDPIFYLHHANVDRLFALWQAINPTAYLPAKRTGQFPNEDTELHPFKKSDGVYWTSKTARDVTAFGYTYPELEATRSDPKGVAQAVAKLYGPSSAANVLKSVSESNGAPRFFAPMPNPVGDKLHTPPSATALQGKKEKVINVSEGTYNEFVANLVVPNTAAKGSFKIFLFFGKPSIEDLTSDINFVGSFDVFTRDDLRGGHVKDVHGQVQLTTALLKLVQKGQLENMKQDTVKDFIEKNLIVLSAGANGGNVAKDSIQVNVEASEVELPQANSPLPVWSEPKTIFQTSV